jgi:hypothetical protein
MRDLQPLQATATSYYSGAADKNRDADENPPAVLSRFYSRSFSSQWVEFDAFRKANKITAFRVSIFSVKLPA